MLLSVTSAAIFVGQRLLFFTKFPSNNKKQTLMLFEEIFVCVLNDKSDWETVGAYFEKIEQIWRKRADSG